MAVHVAHGGGLAARPRRSPQSSSSQARPHVLIVDPDRIVRAHLALAARGAGLETVSASTLAEALAMMALKPCCVIVGSELPDGSGAAFLRKARDEHLPVRVAVAGEANDPQVEWIARMGPDALFLKPVDGDAVGRWLESVAKAVRGAGEVASPRHN